MSVPEDEGYLLPPPEMTTTLSVEVLRIVKRDTRNSGGTSSFCRVLAPRPLPACPRYISGRQGRKGGGAPGRAALGFQIYIEYLNFN